MVRLAIVLALVAGTSVLRAAPPVKSKPPAASAAGAILLEYRVVTTKPKVATVGTLRVFRTPDRTLLVSTWPGKVGRSEARSLYTRDLLLYRSIEPRSDLAQIRPRSTIGLDPGLPLFPRGVLGLEMTAAPPGDQARTTTLIATPESIAYGSIPFHPAETRFADASQGGRPLSFTVRFEGRPEEVWSYPAVRQVGPLTVPTRIIHEEFRSARNGLSADEATEWTLVRVGERPASDLKEERVLAPGLTAPGLTVQDNRGSSDPVAFRYDPKAGALKVQAESAARAQSEARTAERIERTPVWIAIGVFGIVALASVVAMTVGLNRRSGR